MIWHYFEYLIKSIVCSFFLTHHQQCWHTDTGKWDFWRLLCQGPIQPNLILEYQPAKMTDDRGPATESHSNLEFKGKTYHHCRMFSHASRGCRGWVAWDVMSLVCLDLPSIFSRPWAHWEAFLHSSYWVWALVSNFHVRMMGDDVYVGADLWPQVTGPKVAV